MPQDFLPHHGGYKKLRVYKVTEIIYDMTYYFVHHFLEKGDRTVDQMEQAARSGKQNIVEGSMASVTSRETEIKLTNVAKSSLEELLVDYKDFLRVRNLPEWDAVHPRFQRMRDYVQSSDFAEGYQAMMTRLNSEEFANLCITLINQATYMLRRLMESQQKQFLVEGGIREQMTKARLEYRKSHPTDPTGPTSPTSQTSLTGPTSPTGPTG
ncbi:MAG: four helix bundle suffix domain-containing protein, partial [Prevotella sp.]|nr:four helix bundle suffix domain-containing protein [Prevotella sp.]